MATDNKDGCYNYVVSLQKPTAVQFAVVGHFRNSKELDMMMARVTRIEHLLVTAKGLIPHKEIPIFGRIASMSAFRLPDEQLDSLLVLTAKYHLAILGFDREGTPRTRAYGHVANKLGIPAITGIITCVHESGLIGLRLYKGHLKLIQWQDGCLLQNGERCKKKSKVFNVRFEDTTVSDLCWVTDVAFLEDTVIPTLAYFYQDLNGRHLKVCEVDLEARELRPPLWHQSNIEAQATLLVPIPAPYGGLVVVGQESISYQRSPSHFISVAPPLINMARFNCYGRIDRTRFLLGDISGRLFMLLLNKEFTKEGIEEIRDLKIELLGEISIPECLVYLDNSVAFVGSKLGDSQLIRLSTEPVEVGSSNSFVIVIDTFPNLGPIRALELMEVDGQNQLISASGAYKDGSLRIIRSGIGIDEMGTVELAGIKAIFPMRIGSELDNYLVLSFADVTHLLLIDQEELEDTQIKNFDLSQPTLWAGNLSATRLLQISPEFVQLLSEDGQLQGKWQPPSRCRISLASVNPASGQILVSSGPKLFYLCVKSDEILLVGQLECVNEIACLDISPLGDPSSQSVLFTIGFWAEYSVAVYSVQSGTIQLLAEEKLSTEFLPKSLLLVTMEANHYLFVALGDGTVIHFRVNPQTGSLSDQKKFALGTQPTSLRKFTSKKLAINVFACSDRPTVIYSNNRKLSFSNVNLRTVSQMSPLNSDYYRDCLALSDGENLIIGTIQKPHIRTVPLGESVSRVVYQPETRLLAILTSRPELPAGVQQRIGRPSISTTGAKHNAQQQQQQSSYSPISLSPISSTSASISQQQHQHDMMAVDGGIDAEVHSICFLDANTFECLHVLELNKQEQGLSLCTAHLGEDPTPYFVVGTSIVVPEETESKQGRILVIQASLAEIRIVHVNKMEGAVYSCETLSNKLICTFDSILSLFEWTPERELQLKCSDFNRIRALYMKTKGDLVLVGDLMRSICLLTYKPVDSTFEARYKPLDIHSSNLTNACEIVDSETFLYAKTNYNLYCCKIDVNSKTKKDKMRLKHAGLYYLAEMVNAFRRGSIVGSQQRDQNRETLFTNPIIYGTADGGLGAIVQVSPHVFAFLQELQRAIASKTHNCIRIDHSVYYRSFFNGKRLQPATGFVDGDLLEATVAELPRESLQTIVEGLRMRRTDATGEVAEPMGPEDVTKLIEDLAQIY